METKTVRSSLFSQLLFLAIILLPIIFFAGRASASTLRTQYCNNWYNISFMSQVQPIVYDRCRTIFAQKTQAWITGDYSNY